MLVHEDRGKGYRRRFEVVEDYRTRLIECPRSRWSIDWEHVHIDTSRVLTVRAGYRWDGASGPVIQTPDTMEPSLVHDVLYDGMRREKIPQSWRRHADAEYRERLREAGMTWIRRWVEWLGLRLFAARYARPGG